MIPTFRELQYEISGVLREQGGLGAIVVDLAPLAHIERSFGGAAYQALRAQIDPLLGDLKDRIRDGDVVTRDEREGDRFLIFLSGRRSEQSAFAAKDLSRLSDRVADFLIPRIGRLTLPYLRERPVFGVGYGFVLWSPLEGDERQVLRLIEDALTSAGLRQRLRERDER